MKLKTFAKVAAKSILIAVADFFALAVIVIGSLIAVIAALLLAALPAILTDFELSSAAPLTAVWIVFLGLVVRRFIYEITELSETMA